MKPTKFLFIGRTSSGKSTIANAVCEELGLKQVKSYTTRKPRNKKECENSWDHYFVSEEEFEKIGKEHSWVAYTEINNFKYGATKEELDNSNIYVIDPKGVEYLKDKCSNEYNFIEIYFRIPYSVAKKRFINRGGTFTDFKNRYDKESVQFKEYEKNQNFHYHLLNDKSFKESVQTVCEWIKKYL